MKNLSEMFHGLVARHPIDTATLLERMTDAEAAEVLNDQPARQAGRLCQHLDPRLTVRIIELMTPARAAATVETMPRVLAALVVRRLTPAIRDALQAELKRNTANDLERMLSYPEGTVGALVDPTYLSIMDDRSVADALAAIREQPDAVNDHVYLLDRDQQLSGVVTVKSLACTEPEERLIQIRKSVSRILSPSTSLLRMLEDEELRHHGSLPVADESGLYLGALRRESLYYLDDAEGADANRENVREAVHALGELYQLGLNGVIQTAETFSRREPGAGRKN